MKNIGVFFGSRNTEHDISIITAQMIISGLRGLGFNPIPIYLNKSGEWLIGEELGNLKPFTDLDNKILEDKKFSKYYLDLENSVGKMIFKKKGLSGKNIEIELAFPAFHGAYGEDGSFQGLLEIFNIPYVGCNVPASAIAMDKAFTKQFYTANNFPTTKFTVFTKNEWERNSKSLIKEAEGLHWPLFVKPVHGGSSIGISKVKDKNISELINKIEVAFFYDNKVLIEEGVENLMDVTCCVIGNEDPIASKLQESVFSADLFDFEEKYLKDGGGQLGNAEKSIQIPARLDSETTEAIKEMSKEIYMKLGCSGIARIDYLYDKKAKKIYANEINPLPGTLYNHLWKESEIELPELLQKLIDFAVENHQTKQKLSHTFKSTILSSLNSTKLNSKKIAK